MDGLGIKPGEEIAELPDYNKQDAALTAPLFSENEHGDIVIHYYRLQGGTYQNRKEGNKWPVSYTRRRLSVPIGNQKYSSPAGQPLHPWFPPETLWKYFRREKIQQLNLIEGEFKAYAGSRMGADVAGMGSIHGFYDKRYHEQDDHHLHPDLVELIRECQVEVICICFDADALMVKWAYDKDLYERQHSFRLAVANFCKVIQYYVDHDDFALKSVYFAHLKRKFADLDSKGLDDLIQKRPMERSRILTDMRSLNEDANETFYFDFVRLDQNYWTVLEEYFGLENVEIFYERYRIDIGKRQFVYRNARYVAGDGDVKFLFHKDVENFFRIGTDWMKKITVPNKFGDIDEKIIAFNISEISRDYPEKRFPGFVSKIKKFDAYCNEPDWSRSYKREHYGCYNLANPIAHTQDPGEIDVTLSFLKHIASGTGFISRLKDDSELKDIKLRYAGKEGWGARLYTVTEGDKGEVRYLELTGIGDQYTVLLDWLTIFHKYPKQMLPVPILVSKEQGTGKSTFFKWMKAIYGSNVAILNNEQFKMRFNAHYITKSLIIIDEGFLDVDKKAEKERLKQLVTSDTAYVEHKGVNLQEFPYYGKVLLGSNDVDSVMKMESHENRWFVIKVPPLKEEQKDPDLELKLKEEIPAWIDFLSKRAIAHPRQQRLWFKDEYFITDQFRQIVLATKTRVEKNIDDLIKDMFITYKVDPLRLSRKWIVDRLNEQSKYKTDQQEVKRYLDETKGMRLQQPATIQIPVRWNEDITGNGHVAIQWHKEVQRHYVFHMKDWVTADDFSSVEEREAFDREISKTPDPEAVNDNPEGKVPF